MFGARPASRIANSNPPAPVAGGAGGGLMTSVLQVFPSPVSPMPQSSSSSQGSSSLLLSSSGVSQLQQLSALIAVSCALQRQHVLVAHDWGMISPPPLALLCAVPRRVPAVEFTITERTTRDDLSVFLLHADTNAAVADNRVVVVGQNRSAMQPSSSSTNVAGGAAVSLSMRGPNNTSGGGGGGGHVYRQSHARSGSDNLLNDDGIAANAAVTPTATATASTSPKVVYIHSMAQATCTVIDALTDLLVYGILTVNQTTRRVPQLRIVGFVGANDLIMLPRHVRSAFLMSSFMSNAAIQSIAAFEAQGGSGIVHRGRLNDLIVAGCNVDAALDDEPESFFGGARVNRASTRGFGGSTEAAAAGILDLATPPLLVDVRSWNGGCHPIALVHMATNLERYLRHLLLLIRGSLSPFCCQAIGIMSRVEEMIDAMKVLAYLSFCPQNEALSRRRIMVGPSVVQCLLPCFVTHWLVMAKSEWNAIFGISDGGGGGGGGSGGVASLTPPASDLVAVTSGGAFSLGMENNNNNNMTNTAAMPSAVAPSLAGSVFPSSTLGGKASVGNQQAAQSGFRSQTPSAVGLTIRHAGQWDAIAVTSDAICCTVAAAAADGCGSHCDGAASVEFERSQMFAAAAGNTSVLPSDGTATITGATTGLLNTATDATRRPGGTTKGGGPLFSADQTFTMHMDPALLLNSSGARTASFTVGYELCRHVVAWIIRERSDPPPG